MLGALLLPPASITQNRGDELPEWQQQADWLGILAYNLMAGANDYRKAQARINVEEMMARQLELRHAETQAIHEYVLFSQIGSCLMTAGNVIL